MLQVDAVVAVASELGVSGAGVSADRACCFCDNVVRLQSNFGLSDL